MGKKLYKVILTTYGPVHVGCGEQIRKSEYIYEFHKNLVHVVSGPKLTKYLKKRELLTSFLQYLDKEKKRADLKRFLTDNGIKQSEWAAFVVGTRRVCQGKVSKTERNQMQRGNRRPQQNNRPMNDLHLMVRDGQGAAYIPGSSLKGALRTALLENISDDKKDNPLFNLIQISDSEVIPDERLVIYQKIDVNKEQKPMPLYRECVDAGTKIVFTLSIDDDAKLSIEEVEKRIQRFYRNYWNRWFVGVAQTEGGKEIIRGGAVPQALNAKNQPQVIFLGGGAGFVSKTLQYQMYEKEKAREEVFAVLQRRFRKVYGKFRETPKNVPLVLKVTVDYSKDRWYQQGACTIAFEKLEE